MTDRTALAKATIDRAQRMGLPYSYDALYGDGLTIHATVMDGGNPEDALRAWLDRMIAGCTEQMARATNAADMAMFSTARDEWKATRASLMAPTDPKLRAGMEWQKP